MNKQLIKKTHRMSIKNFLIFLLTLVCSTGTVSGQNYSVQNSLDFLVDGINLHYKKSYKSAIREFDKVHRNDTNYAFSLYEKSLSQLKVEDYEGCIESCIKGLEQNSNVFEVSLYTNYGTAYSELEDYDKAIEIYDSALSKYPRNASLKFNKATAVLRAKRYKEGMELLYENVRQNPHHANTHLTLAKICRDLDLHSQALLSYMTYCVMKDAGGEAMGQIQNIDNYLSGDLMGEGEYADIDFLEQGFGEVDEIISNKIAVAARYKTPSDFSYPIVKQSHLLLTSLSTVESTDGFWHEYYVPFYNKLLKDKKFEGFSYYILRSVKSYNEAAAKILSRNQSKSNDFVSWFGENFENFYGLQDYEGNEMQFHYTDSRLLAIGNINDESKEGSWLFFNGTGCVSARGEYEDNEKNGEWNIFYPNGIRKSTYNYEYGVVSGPFKEYTEKGVLEKEGMFKEGRYDGIVIEYFKAGGVFSETEYDMGVESGSLTYYHRNGEMSSKYNVTKGRADGMVRSYDANGNKTMERPFEEGSLNGTLKTWYADGTIKSEQQYVDGLRQGTTKRYHQNGELERESNYKENTQVGLNKKFFDNGKLKSEVIVDEKGKLTGIAKDYYETGELFSEFTYKKGKLIGYRYFKKSGSVLSEFLKKGKYLEYEGRDFEGFVDVKGRYTKGKKDGEWKNYKSNKILISKRQWEDGVQTGNQIFYYYNGQIQREYPTKNDNAHGEFVKYDRKGKEINVGYYEDDDEKGEFVRSNSFGNVTSKVYYNEGRLQGWQTYYTETGVLTNEEFYENGLFMGAIYFDSSGKNPTRVWLNNGNDTFLLKFPNGKTRYQGHYSNGIADGQFTWYHPNGEIATTGKFANGDRDGLWESFYEDGSPRLVRTYQNGDLHGEYVDYFRNGTIDVECIYKSGDIEGIYTRNFWNGKLRYTIDHFDGYRHGLFKTYAPTGELALVRRYVQGINVGYSYLGTDKKLVEEIPVSGPNQEIVGYFSNGKKSVMYTVERNYYVGDFIWYYPTGDVFRKSHYVDGQLQGQLIAYDEKKSILYDYNYKYDNRHGLCKDYYPNGKVKVEYTFFQDDLNGVTRYYNESGNLKSTRYYFDDNYYGEK
ncbi:MAG: antitoxin component YwqK of YwqJK toxin-antitoxin module [Bacteroidia bacterium]|jgi:antitoxin component YwqK of YwqJK toxin-antitoxin module